MRPPIAPGAGVLAEGRPGDGFQCRVNQVLCRRVERIVIKQVQQLGNGGQPLLSCEQTRSRQAVRCPLADFGGRIARQQVQQLANGFLVAQHRQSFHSPEAHFLVSIVRVALQTRAMREQLGVSRKRGAGQRDRLLVNRSRDERAALAALDRPDRVIDRLQCDAPVFRGDLAVANRLRNPAEDSHRHIEIAQRLLDHLRADARGIAERDGEGFHAAILGRRSSVVGS